MPQPFNYNTQRFDVEGAISAYQAGRDQNRQDVERQRQDMLAQYLPKALSGDADARQQAMQFGSPEQQVSLANHFAQMDAQTLAKTRQDQKDLAAMAVAATTPQAWAAVTAEAKRRNPNAPDIPFEQRAAVIAQGQTVSEMLDRALKEKESRTFEQELQLRAAGAPRTDIHMPKQVTKFEEKFGEQLATDYGDIQKAGRAAIEQGAKVARLGALLEKTYTGAGGETIQDLKSIAASLGFKVEGVDEASAARAIANEMALQIRNPDLGPGMPGALSERDITFLVAINPGLTLTKGGNKLLVDYWKRINRRKQDVAALARQYRMANQGVFDEGFNQVVAKFAAEHPLFDEIDMQELSAAMAQRPGDSPVTGKKLRFDPKTGMVR